MGTILNRRYLQKDKGKYKTKLRWKSVSYLKIIIMWIDIEINVCYQHATSKITNILLLIILL